MDRDLARLQEEHPQLFSCQLSSLFTLLDGYDEELAHAQFQFDRKEISDRDFRSFVRKVNYSRTAAQKALDARSKDQGVFARTTRCGGHSSKSTSSAQPLSNSQLPSLLKQSSTNCGEVNIDFDEAEVGKSPNSFHSDPVDPTPEVDPIINPPEQPVPEPPRRPPMEQPQPQQQPLWKLLRKHLVPLTGKESIEMLETKLDMCATAIGNDILPADYIQSLTSVSTEPLLSFLKNEIDAVLPLYAAINPVTNRIKTAVLQRFDKPAHEYATQVLNPCFQQKKTPLQFLYRIRNAGRRATFPADAQPKMTQIRTLKHIPELAHVLFAVPAPTYEQIVNNSINILVIIGEKLESSSSIPTSTSTNSRRTAAGKPCEHCNKMGHEARNCWQRQKKMCQPVL